jgi:hypothetical protein
LFPEILNLESEEIINLQDIDFNEITEFEPTLRIKATQEYRPVIKKVRKK